jgi:aspartyl protease family protein
MRLWILIALGVAGLLIALSHLSPEQFADGTKSMRGLYFGIVLVAAGSSMLVRYRGRMGTAAMHLAIWLGFLFVLLVGYSFRDEIGAHLHAEFRPGYLRQTESGEYMVRAAEDGHFYVDATIGAEPVHFLIDTGSSDIVLPADLAARLGFAREDLRFTQTVSTANGITRGAPIRLAQITVGPKTLNDMPAFVNEGALDTPLLGMRFLRALRTYRVQDDRLFLTF